MSIVLQMLGKQTLTETTSFCKRACCTKNMKTRSQSVHMQNTLSMQYSTYNCYSFFFRFSMHNIFRQCILLKYVIQSNYIFLACLVLRSRFQTLQDFMGLYIPSIFLGYILALCNNEISHNNSCCILQSVDGSKTDASFQAPFVPFVNNVRTVVGTTAIVIPWIAEGLSIYSLHSYSTKILYATL